jgi:hypothetical protein
MEQFAVSVEVIVNRVLLAFVVFPHANVRIPENRNLYVQSLYAFSDLSYRTTIESVLPFTGMCKTHRLTSACTPPKKTASQRFAL